MGGIFLVKMMSVYFLILSSVAAEQNECRERRCSLFGPAIRFPFRLEGIQPQHCGSSKSFDLSCTKDKKTLLRLSNSAKFTVKKINYKLKTVHVVDPGKCLPMLITNLSLYSSPFQYSHKYALTNFTVVYCDSNADHEYFTALSSSCVNPSGKKLYAVYSEWSLNEDLISCTMVTELVSVPGEIVWERSTVLSLSWSNCVKFEGNGSTCASNSLTNKSITLNHPAPDTKTKVAISVSVIGFCALALVAFALYSVKRKNKTEEENRARVEKFLADYEAHKPTRYSYAEVKKITNHFRDELGRGSYGTVYKGKLSDEITVAVKVLNSSKGNGEEFINEVGIIAQIHHVNVAHLVGFCADGFRRALIYEFFPNGSLQKFISPTSIGGMFLGWDRIKDISLGIAKGIDYLHRGCNQRILHFDIKPHNVLLDHNFNPKVSDFGTAKLCSKDQSVVSMTTVRGTVGYIAPEVFSRNFGDVSYKSDVCSFGILLPEMVSSKNKISDNMDIARTENQSQFYFPEWVYKHLEEGKYFEIETEKEDEDEVEKLAKKLVIVGLWCIQWRPLDRPSMSVVVKMLEAKDEPNMPPNPFSRNHRVQHELSTISE